MNFDTMEEAKEYARETDQPVEADINGDEYLVHPDGAVENLYPY